MRMINHSRHPGIQTLHRTPQLPPKDILLRKIPTLHIPRRHVIQKHLIGMSTFQLGLPEMVVRVDEAGGDEFVGAVDDACGRGGRGNSGRNCSDVFALDEEGVMIKDLDGIGAIWRDCGRVYNYGAVLEEDGRQGVVCLGHSANFVRGYFLLLRSELESCFLYSTRERPE